MPEMTQTDAGYLIFDAMLACQELSWASRLPTLVIEMVELDRLLTEFYFSLDKLKDLVHTSYINRTDFRSVEKSFEKDIAPKLSIIQKQLKEQEKKFVHFSVAQKQLDALWVLKGS